MRKHKFLNINPLPRISVGMKFNTLKKIESAYIRLSASLCFSSSKLQRKTNFYLEFVPRRGEGNSIKTFHEESIEANPHKPTDYFDNML